MKRKITILYSVLFAAGLLSGCVMTQMTPHTEPAVNTQPSPDSIPHAFALPAGNNDVVGEPIVIMAQKGDTLSSLAQKYDFGYQDLVSANPKVNPNQIPAGTKIILPAMYILPPAQYRKGIVINIPQLRLFYFTNNEVLTFPVALGREGWRTPIAKTYVYRKVAAPVWHVPESIRQYYFQKYGQEHPKEIGAGPENPLGNYAIYLQMTGYLIHGTNVPSSIGNFVSSGCVRMYNQNVEQLFSYVERGTPVNIIYYPSLAGWRGNELYLESHAEIPNEQELYPVHDVTPLTAIQQAVDQHHAVVDWSLVNEVMDQHTGLPVLIGHQ